MIDVNQFLAARLQQANNTIQAKFQEIASTTGVSFSAQFTRATEKVSSQGSQASEQQKTEAVQDGGMGTEASKSSLLSSQYDDYIEETAARYNVDPVLVQAIMKAESNFDSTAVSRAGAMGLMQLMPATAESVGVSDAFDPMQNIDGGVRVLASMLLRWDGDVKMALASYNCGAGGVSRRGISDLDDPEQYAKLPSETQGYIKRIEGYLESVGASNIMNEKMLV